jgi:hypothetical protein
VGGTEQQAFFLFFAHRQCSSVLNKFEILYCIWEQKKRDCDYYSTVLHGDEQSIIMSDILLDFVDRLVGDDDEESTIPPTTTAWLSAINDNITTTSFDFDQLGEEDMSSGMYCTISSEIFDNKFRAKEFLNTDIIEWMHSFPPRFGKTNDILALLIGTDNEQKGKIL